MNILQCKNVSKVYGSGDNKVVALDKVNLSVEKGEFVAIVGASGSGKSTLLHILGTVDKPTEGTVTIEETDISALNQTQAAVFRRRKVGLVYQFYNLIPTLTIRKNILMPLLLDKRKPNQSYFAQAGSSAKPAFRRTAAAGSHRQVADLPPRPPAGGRAHRQPGSEEFQGNHRHAEVVQPQSEPDHSADHT